MHRCSGFFFTYTIDPLSSFANTAVIFVPRVNVPRNIAPPTFFGVVSVLYTIARPFVAALGDTALHSPTTFTIPYSAYGLLYIAHPLPFAPNINDIGYLPQFPWIQPSEAMLTIPSSSCFIWGDSTLYILSFNQKYGPHAAVPMGSASAKRLDHAVFSVPSSTCRLLYTTTLKPFKWKVGPALQSS